VNLYSAYRLRKTSKPLKPLIRLVTLAVTGYITDIILLYLHY